jgi:holliday junction DNA helicase RuvA
VIGKLTGILDSVTGNTLLIDVNGVGYVVTCSGRTITSLGPAGGRVGVLVETQVREDAISLFGFAHAEERDAFRLLTTVQGVGAKVALAILSTLSPPRLMQAIAAGDKAALSEADGVGPKLAVRLCTELKDKVAGKGISLAAALPAAKDAAPSGAAEAGADVMADAVSALVNLGYRRVDAFAAIATAAGKVDASANLNDLIRLGLRELSQ